MKMYEAGKTLHPFFAGGKVAKLRKSGAGGVLASSAELQSGDMLLVRLDTFPLLQEMLHCLEGICPTLENQPLN
jgi:hypothetical protein